MASGVVPSLDGLPHSADDASAQEIPSILRQISTSLDVLSDDEHCQDGDGGAYVQVDDVGPGDWSGSGVDASLLGGASQGAVSSPSPLEMAPSRARAAAVHEAAAAFLRPLPAPQHAEQHAEQHATGSWSASGQKQAGLDAAQEAGAEPRGGVREVREVREDHAKVHDDGVEDKGDAAGIGFVIPEVAVVRVARAIMRDAGLRARFAWWVDGTYGADRIPWIDEQGTPESLLQ